MDFALTEDQLSVRDLARRIFSDRVTLDRLKEVEAGRDGFDRALWKELGAANLLGVALPEDAGGGGYGLVEVCLVLEEAAGAVAPVPLMASMVMAALPVAAFGTPEQRTRLLPGLAAGESMLSAALAESVPVTATREGEGWHLRGAADAVPVAHAAARVLVPARTDDGDTAVFLVDPADAKLERQEVTTGEPAFRMELDAVVAGQDVLAEPPHGAEVLRWTMDRALVALAITQVGLAERALRITADYTSERSQFGKPLGAFQAVQQRIADAYIDVEAMRLTAWRAAWLLSEGLAAEEEVAVAKFWAAEGGPRVLQAAQHLHGGMGVDVDYPLHRYTKYAKQMELALGGATAQLARLGDLIAEGTK